MIIRCGRDVPLEALLEDVSEFRELEKTYLKVIKALNFECSRLEEEVNRLKRLEEEVEYLRQLELWYIKALKGLNEECNRLERELYELKRRSIQPAIKVDFEGYLRDCPALMKLLAFAEGRIRVRSLRSICSQIGVDVRKAQSCIDELAEIGMVYMKNGYAELKRDAQQQLRRVVLRSIPDREEIIGSLNADAVEVVELLRQRRGVLTPEKFEELDAEKKAALQKLLETGLLFRTIDREGDLIYFMPEEIMELMEELRVELAKRSATSREELMKKLNIKDPSEEEIELILSTLEEGEELGEGSEHLIEAFRNEDIGVLVDALKSGDTHARRFAVSALWKIGSQDAIKHLTEALEDSDVYVRRLAISALIKNPSEDLVEPMIKKLEDEDSMVRYSAASYFDNYPHPRAFNSLLKALKDEDSMVRAVAASALGKLGIKEAVPYLIEALRDEDAWVRYSAAEALDKLKAKAG